MSAARLNMCLFVLFTNVSNHFARLPFVHPLSSRQPKCVTGEHSTAVIQKGFHHTKHTFTCTQTKCWMCWNLYSELFCGRRPHLMRTKQASKAQGLKKKCVDSPTFVCNAVLIAPIYPWYCVNKLTSIHNHQKINKMKHTKKTKNRAKRTTARDERNTIYSREYIRPTRINVVHFVWFGSKILLLSHQPSPIAHVLVMQSERAKKALRSIVLSSEKLLLRELS